MVTPEERLRAMRLRAMPRVLREAVERREEARPVVVVVGRPSRPGVSGAPSAPGEPPPPAVEPSAPPVEPEPTPFKSMIAERMPAHERFLGISKRIELARRYRQPVTMTPQQYFQEVHEAKREAGRQYSEYQTMVEGIDPSESYRYKGSVMTGATLKAKLRTEYGKPMREREQQLQLAWQQARDVPKGTVITKKKDVYTFKPRDTSLDWSRREIEKIERAPPVVREVAMFGFTAISGFAALGKPAAEVVARARGVKTRPVHYISAFDIAFEPVGWSPKGSVKLIKRTGVPGWAGMAASETLQVAAMSQIFKPISAGVKIGVKAVIKKAPSVYVKFTKVFPEEKLVTGITGKATKVTFRPILGGERVAGTVYRWGAKGYRKGLELTSVGVKTTPKEIIKKTSSIIEKQKQKFVYGKSGVKRVWLSPEKFATAEKDIAAKLALKKTIEYSPQARIKAGVGTAEEFIGRTRFKLSWTGKRLIKKYKTTREIWTIGKEASPLYKTHRVGVKSGIERYALEGAKEPIVSRGWYQTVKEMYTRGYTRIVPTETGYLVSVSKGFGTAGTRPMAKRWITRYRPPFLKNIQARTSVTLQQLGHKARSETQLLGRRGKLISKPTVTIPSSMYTPVYETGLSLSSLALLKTVTEPKTKRELKPELITLQQTKQRFAFKKAVIPIQDVVTIPSTKMDRMLGFKLDIKTITVPDVVQDRLYKTDVPVHRPARAYITTVPGFGVPWFPRLGLYGRGRMFWDEEGVKKKYRFRMFVVPDLFGTKKKKKAII